MNENTTKPETTKPETAAVTTPATTPEIKLPVSENVISALDRLAQQGALAQ